MSASFLGRIGMIMVALGVAVPSWAWSDAGHMMVAYIAYQKLEAPTRSRVDALLQRNPMYTSWTSNVPAARRGLVAFVMAATWPDCIKQPAQCPGYQNVGGDRPPGNSTDGQNIGYKDKLMHKYWHFVDAPYEAGAPGEKPAVPNAATQINLFIQAIGATASDDIKSYDVVWLEHLIGDVHQPLHATSRFTKNHPHGDAGGNFIAFCKKPCSDELHGYWDSLFGGKSTVDEVEAKATPLLQLPKPAGADDANVDTWTTESFTLAKTKVYVAPISADNDPKQMISPRPDNPYHDEALKTAQARVLQAGYRLANVLNKNLK